jgi:hypothetical protein
MVTATYEHIVLILIVGVIFIGTVVALPAMNYSTFQDIDQQQLKNTALNVLTSMLLSDGSPADWDSKNQTEIEEFGLAYSGSLSKYVLDSDKVQRLNPDSYSPLTPEKVQSLLRLQGYGYKFSLYRPFTADPDVNIPENYFSVRVTRGQDNAPIPNAEVNVTSIVSGPLGDFDFHSDSPITTGRYFTNIMGICKEPINADLDEVFACVSIMKITAGGMTTTVVEQDDDRLQDILGVNTNGDTVTIARRGTVDPSEVTISTVHIYGSWAYTSEDADPTLIYESLDDKDFINFGSESGQHNSVIFDYSGLSDLDPAAIIVLAGVNLNDENPEGESRTPLFIVGPFMLDTIEEVFSLTSGQQTGNIIATTRRFVVISGMTYIAELSLWKE